uniref:EGF-like domain-containing protein n=1 Tax=Leersia perrieri TaxID=77586 RepID=A0A0D9VMF5_9ORYZ
MATIRLMSLQVAVFLVLLAPVTPPVSAQKPAAHCLDKCGNISIPYPFGIGADCARDEGFQLHCDRNESTPRLLTYQFKPPQQLVNLSLADGEARVLLKPETKCIVEERSADLPPPPTSYTFVNGSTTYRYSAKKNRLVALGCPNLGYIVDGSDNYVSGCMSACRPSLDSPLPAPCTGERCCQINIPPTLNFYVPRMYNFDNLSTVDAELRGSTTPCRHVFLVEQTWIETVYNDTKDFNRLELEAMPVVLEWAIRNVYNCSAGKRKTTDYACRSANSDCFNTTDNQGYRCRCYDGYEGNPYLDGGCKDIDECQRQKEYPCFGKCTNTQGNHTCVCPPGTSGNAKQENGCRPTD